MLPYLDHLDEKFTQKDKDLMRALLASNGDLTDSAIATTKSVKTVKNQLPRLAKKLLGYRDKIRELKKLAGIENEEIICPHCRKRFRKVRKN